MFPTSKTSMIKFTLSPWEYGYVFSALSNHIGGVMANVLSLRAVDRGIKP